MLVRNIFKVITILAVMALPIYSKASDPSVPASVAYGNNAAVGKYAHVNGIKMYYEIYGRGAPLVLIHGNGDSIAGLAAQIDYFSRYYKVIVADSRGHGKSGLGTDQLTYPMMMEDWHDLLTGLNVSKAKIFGWSDGGILGLLMAIKYPENIDKLAIMGANLRPDETAVYSWVQPILMQARTHVEAMIAQKDTSNDWGLQRQLLNLLTTQPDIDVKSLQQIKLPVLVMAGDRDVIKEEHTLEIFQNLENAHLAILPGNTHFAPVNDSVKFNALLSDFFKNPFTKPSTEDLMAHH
ncbi:MAG: alpha/beta hydrolase [Emcibacter sp.]|nr:alpha/beta hydrolase [Emcibacter sp.]